MANILITDLYEESAYLVRSILRGVGHAVSIAITREDAEAKLATGLFDTLVVDYCTIVAENLAVGRFANEMLPGMPLVALTRPELESKLASLAITSRFGRPIRGQRVKDAMAQAMNALQKMAARRAVPRLHAALPVELECDGVKFSSATIDLSARGMAVDATEVKLTPVEFEALEGHVRGGIVRAKLTVEPGRIIELAGRVAFVERHRSLSGRTVGVCFDKMDEQTEIALGLLTRQAA
ncbi:MAG: PilZ domain-containing protein [Planctomycetes bacterium]|nr:PilZ domain-containing protein [Planctomycetota bacterium]